LIDGHLLHLAAAGDGDDAEMKSSTGTEGPALSFLHVLTFLSNSFVMLYMYRSRRKGSASEIQGESVHSWAKRVAPRTVEGLKGHGTPSQVKRSEQTRLDRSTVQVRTSSKAEIGMYCERSLAVRCLTMPYVHYMHD
jgi:hypothetical protein